MFDAREALNAKAEALSQEIARYLARHDSYNTDPTVDPIDLLREVHRVFEIYDDELDQLDRQIEQLKAGYP